MKNCTPVMYTEVEGGAWKPFPKGITIGAKQLKIYKSALNHVSFPKRLRVHSLILKHNFWGYNIRWDCVTGVTHKTWNTIQQLTHPLFNTRD